jgi:S-adenosylmethionine synthetase
VWNVSNSVSGLDRISLIGSLYRIISKALANRLKVVMREVVGDCQVWFVIDVWTLFTSSSIC